MIVAALNFIFVFSFPLQAKYHLRTKKTLERRADKLCTLIDNLTVIAFQIEEAQTDARVILQFKTYFENFQTVYH